MPLISAIIIIISLLVSVSFLIGFRFYRLLRQGTIRVRIILPDGRSNTYLTRITSDKDIRVDRKSYQYDESCVTFEGLLKIPTLEYITTNRKPLARRTPKATIQDALTPDAAYDGITSHIMRELLTAFSETVLTPTIALLVTISVIVVMSGAVYYGVHKDVKAIDTSLQLITSLLPTPTPIPIPTLILPERIR